MVVGITAHIITIGLVAYAVIVVVIVNVVANLIHNVVAIEMCLICSQAHRIVEST